MIVSLRAEGSKFELFGSARPVDEQAGWRHLDVARRLPALGGEGCGGGDGTADRMKTEPTFVRAPGLDGDPYGALLELYGCENARLSEIIARLR